MPDRKDVPERIILVEDRSGGERFSIPYGSLKPIIPTPGPQVPAQPLISQTQPVNQTPSPSHLPAPSEK